MSNAAYEPEPWDVVRSDGITVIHGVDTDKADKECLKLNSEAKGTETYEVRESA